MVYEDLREEVSKGQKEGKECDVIEAVEEQKKSKLSYHTMGMNMAEWKKRQTCMLPYLLSLAAQRGLCPLPSEVQNFPGQQLRGEWGSMFNGALKITGFIWSKGR